MRAISRLSALAIALLPLTTLSVLEAQVVVVVTPDGATDPVRNQNTGGYTALFRVTNETPGGGSTQFSISCNTHGPVTCDSIRPATVTLNNGSATFQDVTAYYTVGAAGTDHKGTLVGKALSGGVSDSGCEGSPA